MKIGEDFPKIEFEMFGLDLVEPNAIIGDTILFLTAIFFAIKIGKFTIQNDFFKNGSMMSKKKKQRTKKTSKEITLSMKKPKQQF